MSAIAALSQFDLWSKPPIQLAIEKELTSQHRPIAAINDASSPLTFVIPSSDEEMLNLNSMMLRLRLKFDLKKDTTATADWNKITPSNFLLHSFFKSVELEINDKLVTSSQQTYSLKAYIGALTNFTSDARRTVLAAAGWHDTEATRKSWILPSPVNADGTGTTIELMGKLHIDMSFQPKALVAGSVVKIMLLPHSNPHLYLVNTSGAEIKTTIEDAVIEITRSKMSEALKQAHRVALSKAPALYPISRSEVKIFNVNVGTSSATFDNVCLGILPRRAVVAFTKHTALSGAATLDPFLFENHGLNFLAFNFNSEQYPAKAFTPDYERKMFKREYLSIFEAFNQTSTDAICSITLEDYPTKFAMYAVNFSQDGSDGSNQSGHSNIRRKGSLNLEVRFKDRISSNALSCIVFLEYDNLVEIDSSKSVRTDYI